jgi:hypothetical protein
LLPWITVPAFSARSPEINQQLAVVFALGFAVARRDRLWLALAEAALVWAVIEIAFALYGWSAVSRYLIEPGAVMIVIVGAAVGRGARRRPAAFRSVAIVGARGGS